MVPLFLKLAGRAIDKLIGTRTAPSTAKDRVRKVGAMAVGIIAACAAAAGNPIFMKTADALAGFQPAQILSGPPDEPWVSSRDELRRLVESASVIITSEDIQTTFYAGDFDLQLSRYKLDAITGERPPKREFVRDPQTGRLVISSADSIRRVMQCYRDGVVIILDSRWRNPAYVTDDVADLLQATTRLSKLKSRSSDRELLVFEWNTEAMDSANCDEIFAALAKT